MTSNNPHWETEEDVRHLAQLLHDSGELMTAADIAEELNFNTTNQARLRMEYLLKTNSKEYGYSYLYVEGAHGGQHKAKAIANRARYSGNPWNILKLLPLIEPETSVEISGTIPGAEEEQKNIIRGNY